MWLWLSLLFVMLWVVVLCAGIFWPLIWQAKNTSLSLAYPYRWFAPWWRYWHYVCVPLLSWRHRQHLHRLVTQTGQQIEQIENVFAYQCLAATLTWMIGGVFILWKTSIPLYGLTLVGVFSAAMYWYPVSVLYRTIRLQHQQIQRDFPFMLDLLTLSIEAGMGILSALQVCVAQLPQQALRQHLQTTLDDLRTGLSREQAFARFAERTALDEAHAFVAALQQSFELGGSLGPLLRQQAEQRRQERFLRAEKKALEAPVKMLLPLVVCIFPCTFLVIGYPLFYQLWQNL